MAPGYPVLQHARSLDDSVTHERGFPQSPLTFDMKIGGPGV